MSSQRSPGTRTTKTTKQTLETKRSVSPEELSIMCHLNRKAQIQGTYHTTKAEQIKIKIKEFFTNITVHQGEKEINTIEG